MYQPTYLTHLSGYTLSEQFVINFGRIAIAEQKIIETTVIDSALTNGLLDVGCM